LHSLIVGPSREGREVMRGAALRDWDSSSPSARNQSCRLTWSRLLRSHQMPIERC